MFGRTKPRTGIDPFVKLVAQVMSQEPCASAKWAFWIVDTAPHAAARRGRTAGCRVPERGSGAHLGARSWLNQVEIYSSVVQRKVVTRGPCRDALTHARRHNTLICNGRKPADSMFCVPGILVPPEHGRHLWRRPWWLTCRMVMWGTR